MNWPQNDFWEGDLITSPPDRQRELIHRAKQLSLSFLYWMQTEAPRPDGGQGWKGLRLRDDIVDTADGLAKAPYIRESRRIRAEFTILEQHVGTEMRMGKTGASREDISAEPFFDSVGVGCYRIDLHPSAGKTNYIDVSSLPFQIPLGALIPKRARKSASGMQEHRDHAHHERVLPTAPRGVEHRRGRGGARRAFHQDEANAASNPQFEETA